MQRRHRRQVAKTVFTLSIVVWKVTTLPDPLVCAAAQHAIADAIATIDSRFINAEFTTHGGL